MKNFTVKFAVVCIILQDMLFVKLLKFNLKRVVGHMYTLPRIKG